MLCVCINDTSTYKPILPPRATHDFGCVSIQGPHPSKGASFVWRKHSSRTHLRQTKTRLPGNHIWRSSLRRISPWRHHCSLLLASTKSDIFIASNWPSVRHLRMLFDVEISKSPNWIFYAKFQYLTLYEVSLPVHAANSRWLSRIPRCFTAAPKASKTNAKDSNDVALRIG